MMQFNIKQRCGPARLATINYKKKIIKTPNIFFIDTKRFKSPSFAELKLSKKDKEDLISSDIFVIENALQLFLKSRDFVDYIVKLKNDINYQKPIYMPAVGEPVNFALLTYLGIDLFDSSLAIIEARNGNLFNSTGKINKDEISELACACPSCINVKVKPTKMNFEQILKHNHHMILNEIKNVRNSINSENLRNLVESRVINDPHLTSILKNLDKNHYDFLEKHTPISSNAQIIATTNESFNRPEIKRFQERIINRYKKPKSAKILLLLPCSAKKPYSFSKSHKLFRDSINSNKNSSIIHELIITSPIGLVPRELELIYPASNYDIPVTGVWNEDEKKMVCELLKKYLKKNQYDKIIVHLPSEISSFVKDIIDKPIITCKKRPTSKNSLKNLLKTLEKIVDEYDKIKYFERKKEDIKGFASYQFGIKISEKLLKDSEMKGRYPNQKIISNKKQLGMIVGKRGFISLTLHGAEKMLESERYWAEIYDDFTLKGSVFAPGLKDCDEDIRIGDEVIVLRNKKLCGVGVALMNGKEMKQSNHGEAIKIRHHT
jgi:archaeosine synthase